MKIIGLDICKDHAAAWILDEYPDNLKKYWEAKGKTRTRIYKTDPQKDELSFYFNNGGIDHLLSLKPEAIALEPTGHHYSRLIAHVAQQEGIEILWVGHQEVANFRKSNRLPNKNDIADSLALAAYAHLYYGRQQHFIKFQPDKPARLKELYLQLKSINRFRNPLIARLKLQLSHEFPEAATTQMSNAEEGSGYRRPLICWLACRERPERKRKNSYWQNRYEKSVAVRYGLEISLFTRKMAEHIDDYDLQEIELRQEMETLVYSEEFTAYNKAFDSLNLTLPLRALLLSLIYPLPKRNDLEGFKQRIGLGKDEVASGDMAVEKTGSGSKLCRTEFYMWVKCAIAPRRRKKTNTETGQEEIAIATSHRPPTKEGQEVGRYYDDWVERMTANREEWQNYLKTKAKKEAIKTIEAGVKQSFAEIGLENESLLNSQLLLLKGLFEQNFKVEDAKLNVMKSSGSFRNLITCKTAAYAARWLYRALKRELSKS